MPANTTPRFESSSVLGAASISVSNTSRDGTGTMETIVTAGNEGTKVTRVRGVASGTVTNGTLRLFHFDGQSTRLYAELPVTATTPSVTLAVWSGAFALGGDINLEPGHELRVSTDNAESFNVFAHGGHF